MKCKICGTEMVFNGRFVKSENIEGVESDNPTDVYSCGNCDNMEYIEVK